MIFKIPRCYDSHLHLVPTGEMAATLDLSQIRIKADFRKLEMKAIHYREDWLVGWGFDDLKWQEGESLDRQTLDEYFPDSPVAFSRRDGHVIWLNTKALKKLSFLKTAEQWPKDLLPYIEFGSDGLPTGSLKDRALDLVLFALPKSSDLQMRTYFEQAFSLMLRQGFTHVREMMGTWQMWQVLQKMEESKDLYNYVEMNFHCPHLDQLDETLKVISEARASESKKLRSAAVKIFIDGALGSSGAFLSKNYEDGAHQGTLLWPDLEIREAIRKSWSLGVPVSLHTLGDGASQVALEQAQALYSEGVVGQLHLEHVEIMNDKSIQLLKGLDVVCHIQPSHFTSDQDWLRQKLGARIRDCFPWQRLESAGVPFFFGSDTPIEPPSLTLTKKSLLAAQNFGIPAMKMDWTFPHSHPDKYWGGNCWTEISKDGEVQKVFVDNESIAL